MKTQAAIFRMVERMLARGGSRVTWTRRFLTSGGASGVVTEAAPPQTVTVQAAQLTEKSMGPNPPSWWASATLRIAVAAQALPFAVQATEGASPAVELLDEVTWGGQVYRVTNASGWWAPGRDTGPRPYLYFVALEA